MLKFEKKLQIMRKKKSQKFTPQREVCTIGLLQLNVIILTIALLIRLDDDPATLSLAESAALQQAKEVKPELKEVEIVTGEENESNVFKVRSISVN